MNLTKRRCPLLVLCIFCILLILCISFLYEKEPQVVAEELPIEPVKSLNLDEKQIDSISEPVEEIIVEPEPEPEPEPDLYEGMNRIDNVKITYYCAEKYHHICNAGHPYKTARGNDVIPYYTCAVDPNVIPLGCTVYVDYGDGIMHEYYADDTGGSIKGNRIDIALETHDDAMESGVRYATVYWKN